MKITKKHLCDLPSCYAASSVELNGRILLLLAPDAPGPCYAFDSETFEKQTVREKPGGTMAMVPLPGGNGDFLAVQRFFPGFQAQDAEIVYVQNRGVKRVADTLFKLPYIHRFDILERGGVRYILCATLCTVKKNADDWSSPGALYAAELPVDMNRKIALEQIAGGLTRNHGFWHVNYREYTRALTSCDQGVYEVSPPAKRGGKWTVRKVLDKPISDIALCDIDGDGVDELAAIEPFHGTKFTIYSKTAEGFTPLYRYPGNTEFLHVVWGGKLRDEPAFIGGCRGGNKDLFLLRWKNGEIVNEIIDTGTGPSNVAVVNGKDGDFILAANHENGEGAVYIITDN